MAIKVKKQKGACKVTLEGDITIYEASDVHAKFKELLASCDSMDIDLQNVTEIDSSGVQILMTLKRSAVAEGKTVTLSMHSEAVLDVFELLNIAHEFGDPIVLSHREAG